MAYQAEKLMKDHADKIDDNLKESLTKAIADVKKALEADDIEGINSTTKTLEEKLHKLSEKIYQSASQQNAANASQGAAGFDPSQFAQGFGGPGAGAPPDEEQAEGGREGGATYGKKKDKKKVVDVDWEDEDQKKK
jgi:molecular chaperone DnaK